MDEYSNKYVFEANKPNSSSLYEKEIKMFICKFKKEEYIMTSEGYGG